MAPIGEPSLASRHAAKSSSEYFVGRHIRGLWLKIWIESQPISVPRSTAFASPPLDETCAPINMSRTGSACAVDLPGSVLVDEVEGRALRNRLAPLVGLELRVGGGLLALQLDVGHDDVRVARVVGLQLLLAGGDGLLARLLRDLLHEVPAEGAGAERLVVGRDRAGDDVLDLLLGGCRAGVGGG